MAKQIPLRNCDDVLIVDDEHYEFMSQFRWFRGARGYALTYIKKEKIPAHHVLQPVEPPLVTDHIDRNRLNCTRENLRAVTPWQNAVNKSKQTRKTTSRFKGVRWRRERRKWEVTIICRGKRWHLGRFDDEEFAARVYDAAASELFEGYGALNFPDEPIWDDARQQFEAVKNRHTTSRFVGVYWDKRAGRWQAYVTVMGKYKHIGFFSDEEEAARARDRYVIEHGLTRHKLNFPDENPSKEDC